MVELNFSTNRFLIKQGSKYTRLEDQKQEVVFPSFLPSFATDEFWQTEIED